MHLTLEQWSYIFEIAVPVGLLLRWIYQWAVRVDTAATNHIPHIYAILRRMCDHLKIDYVDLEGDLEAHKTGNRDGDRSDT